VVREAFRSRGHDAYSCDLIHAEPASDWHIRDDVLKHLDDGWDIGIFHPPCTHLANSGARWFKNKVKEQADAIEFVRRLLDAPIDRIAIENPIGVLSRHVRKPDQIVHPWQFGHSASKSTCLWLKNLPLLQPTNIVDKGEFHTTKSGRRIPKWYNLPPSPDRGMKRSITFEGFADAMAEQWGNLA